MIYSIVRVSNLRAGSTIGVRWYANGVLVEEGQCWTPNRDWEDVCAYCDLRPSGTVFEAGSWSVEMLLDGEVMSQASFQVTGSGADMGATGDQGGDKTTLGYDRRIVGRSVAILIATSKPGRASDNAGLFCCPWCAGDDKAACKVGL